MPSIKVDSLKSGDKYDRPFLANLWGYSDWQAISRGIITPTGDNIIVLFITKEKQEALEQYNDELKDDCLHMDGERNHTNDERLANSLNKDKVYLFYREIHHSLFTYYGEVFLAHANIKTGSEPSRFIFMLSRFEAIAVGAIATEEITHGNIEEEFVPDVEGRKIIRTHIEYERSRKNRAKAIELHGTDCIVCGFNFNKYYGAELARDYIEVHHIKSITKIDGPIDINVDLVPLCSNCHSMIHRNGNLLSVEELKSHFKDAISHRQYSSKGCP